MSGFVKRFLLAAVASRLTRLAHRRGRNPLLRGLLHEIDHHLARQHRYGHHGSYRHRGHNRYHGHYRRKHW